MSSGNDLKYDSLVEIESVSKTYISDSGFKINVLEDVNFKITRRETGVITSILAPFGSGKSTLLKIISGLIEPSTGKINFGEYNRKKNIPYIPEKSSSFPWFNVEQNIGLALSNSEDKKFSSDQLISLMGLKGYENHFPDNKSSGFRFRISLACAMAVNPPLILIDDSFKTMKKESRLEIHSLLKDLSLKMKQNFLIATTNLIEAIQLSDKIIIMKKGPGKIIRELEIKNEDKPLISDHKSEIFTTLKSEIETSFEAAESLSTINYSV